MSEKSWIIHKACDTLRVRLFIRTGQYQVRCACVLGCFASDALSIIERRVNFASYAASTRALLPPTAQMIYLRYVIRSVLSTRRPPQHGTPHPVAVVAWFACPPFGRGAKHSTACNVAPEDERGSIQQSHRHRPGETCHCYHPCYPLLSQHSADCSCTRPFPQPHSARIG